MSMRQSSPIRSQQRMVTSNDATAQAAATARSDGYGSAWTKAGKANGASERLSAA